MDDLKHRARLPVSTLPIRHSQPIRGLDARMFPAIARTARRDSQRAGKRLSTIDLTGHFICWAGAEGRSWVACCQMQRPNASADCPARGLPASERISTDAEGRFSTGHTESRARVHRSCGLYGFRRMAL